MEELNVTLTVILNEAEFDIEYGRTGSHIKRGLRAGRFRETYFRAKEQAVDRRARVNAPERLMAKLVATLRRGLQRFIDPKTDKIGHAFPTETHGDGRFTTRANGLYDIEYASHLPDFASAVVQASAIIGVKETTRLLKGWEGGEPVRIHMSTVLSNLFLSASLSPRDDIQLVPLALTSSQLPRVPVSSGVTARDYLGLTLLKLETSASPALFRPNANERGTVESRGAEGITLDLLCEALSLQANRYVSRAHLWHDHQDAAAFRLAIERHWSQGGDHLERIDYRSANYDEHTGVVTVLPDDDVSFVELDQVQLRDTLKALRLAHKQLRIAVNRWRRSKRRNVNFEDAYIDIRIALECLYLKDFVNEHSGEMRFRLSLMGAWHLSANLDERRTTRKILRDAYDTGSKAVHLGEVQAEAHANLAAAQDLCRRGILKLLRDGPPPDWGDLVLGGDRS